MPAVPHRALKSLMLASFGRLSEAILTLLRPYQRTAVREWAKHGRRGIVVMPTGAGKTLVGVAAIADALSAGVEPEDVMVVTYSRALVDQWRNVLTTILGPRGGEVRVVTYAWLAGHSVPENVRLLVLDECHHANSTSKSGMRVREYVMRGGWVLGLTAVPPWMLSEISTVATVGNIVYQVPYTRLAEKGVLAPFEVRTILTADNEDEKIATVAELARTLAEAGHKVMVYCNRLETAEKIAERLREMGVEVSKLYGTGVMSDRERRENLERFRRGETSVMILTPAGDEGIDLPEADTVILAEYTRSPRVLVQRIGRALRPRPGKVATVYLVGERDKVIKMYDVLSSIGMRLEREEVERLVRRMAEEKTVRRLLHDIEVIKLARRAIEEATKGARGIENLVARLAEELGYSLDRLYRLSEETAGELTDKDRAMLLGIYILDRYLLYRAKGYAPESALREAKMEVMRDLDRRAKTIVNTVKRWLSRTPWRCDIPKVDTPSIEAYRAFSLARKAVEKVVLSEYTPAR